MQTISDKADGEAGVLDRPHRTTVIAVRVIGLMTVRQCPYAPPTEQVVAEHPIGDPPDEAIVDDACRETVARVRADGLDRTLVAVDGHREVTQVLHPEDLVETGLQLTSLPIEMARFLRLVEPPQELRHVQ